ncbi:MAG TPA: glycosyltransferase [Acidimicrobiales bacterium]|nr:glycosyltransferase [Acidimicrobiales bacterium]
MKAGVYNRYWATGGGAEKYGAVIAQLLAQDFEVDILTHDPVDRDWLGDRFQLDLSQVKVRELDDRSGVVTEASADYDLFSNVSFMSTNKAAGPRSFYVVHFPTATTAQLSRPQRFVVDHLGGVRSSLMIEMEWGTGFYHREHGRRAPIWTSGDASVRLVTPPDQPVPVHIAFGYHRPAELPPAQVQILLDGTPVREFRLGGAASRVQGLRGHQETFDVVSPAPGVPVEVRIVSDTFVPAEVLGGADHRVLGVPLLGLQVGVGPARHLARLFPILLTPPSTSRWTDTYGALVANSQFTRGWIERYWEVDSEVIHPPVSMQPAGERQPLILNVGRFFPADGGHSKKQLELVRAFRCLCDAGLSGWSLHLVGGCAGDGEGYLRRVRDLAAGYPVEVHVNVSGEELQRLYGSASVYWHASGLGENEQRRPDRLEHFGITTVEAMSAGAVPVVIGLAGQLETVRHGVDGFHFQTLEGLVGLTRMLIDDPSLRDMMSASAARRARNFDLAAFETRLDDLVRRVMALPETAALGST